MPDPDDGGAHDEESPPSLDPDGEPEDDRAEAVEVADRKPIYRYRPL